VLHLAANASESEVEAALVLLLDAGTAPTFEAVRALVHVPGPGALPTLTPAVLDLSVYDQLLAVGGVHA
jgi:pantothenate kinase type III